MAISRAAQGEMKAVGGWRKDDEVTIYTEAVEQEDMADAGMARVVWRFSSKMNPKMANLGGTAQNCAFSGQVVTPA